MNNSGADYPLPWIPDGGRGVLTIRAIVAMAMIALRMVRGKERSILGMAVAILASAIGGVGALGLIVIVCEWLARVIDPEERFWLWESGLPSYVFIPAVLIL